MDSAGLTSTTILRYTMDRLMDGGYRTIALQSSEALPEKSALAEDPFGIALIAVFETWGDLVERWPQAQGYLVNRITETVPSINPKAWDGYLVLMTPAYSENERAEDEIRYDTSRLRKLVGTGETMQSLIDIDSVLLPILPLDDSEVGETQDRPLRERLYALLRAEGVQSEIASSVLESFEAHDSGVLENLLPVIEKCD